MKINQYKISNDFSYKVISANNAKSAWRKFCRLYFGDLKPARSDYTVERAS